MHVEDWAEAVAAERGTHNPGWSMFMGDYRGVYIDPERATVHGIESSYAASVLVTAGEWIEWTGSEFVRLPKVPAAPSG